MMRATLALVLNCLFLLHFRIHASVETGSEFALTDASVNTPSVSIDFDLFPSLDPNIHYDLTDFDGKDVHFVLSHSQEAFISEMSMLQTLQGMPVPNLSEGYDQYKHYIENGNFTWHHAKSLKIIIPWFRYCQMERSQRWMLNGGKYIRATPEHDGSMLDVATAQTFMRMLLASPPKPPNTYKGEPPEETKVSIVFMDLHEPEPVKDAIVSTGRVSESNFINLDYFSHFLAHFQQKCEMAFKTSSRCIFVAPDLGAFKRFEPLWKAWAEKAFVGRDAKQFPIYYIAKVRVGAKTSFDAGFHTKDGVVSEADKFGESDAVLLADDFTNSGGTLINCVNQIQKFVAGVPPVVTVFVSHFVAGYQKATVQKLAAHLASIPKMELHVTDSIPEMAQMLKEEAEGKAKVMVHPISPFIAEKLPCETIKGCVFYDGAKTDQMSAKYWQMAEAMRGIQLSSPSQSTSLAIQGPEPSIQTDSDGSGSAMWKGFAGGVLVTSVVLSVVFYGVWQKKASSASVPSESRDIELA